MTSRQQPWDAGLQPERTALAWQRFAAALAGVGIGTLKVLSHTPHQWALILTSVVVLAGAITIGLQGTWRYRATHDALNEGRLLPDGRLNTVAVTAVAALAMFAAVTVLLN